MPEKDDVAGRVVDWAERLGWFLIAVVVGLIVLGLYLLMPK